MHSKLISASSSQDDITVISQIILYIERYQNKVKYYIIIVYYNIIILNYKLYNTKIISIINSILKTYLF